LQKPVKLLFPEIPEVPESTVSCYFYESCVLVHGYVCFCVTCENASFSAPSRWKTVSCVCSLSVCLRVRLWIWWLRKLWFNCKAILWVYSSLERK